MEDNGNNSKSEHESKKKHGRKDGEESSSDGNISNGDAPFYYEFDDKVKEDSD